MYETWKVNMPLSFWEAAFKDSAVVQWEGKSVDILLTRLDGLLLGNRHPSHIIITEAFLLRPLFVLCTFRVSLPL